MSYTIKDLLYFDSEKTLSIYSQIDEGVITQYTEEEETKTAGKSDVGINVKVFKANVGTHDEGKESYTVTKIPYHDLLNRLQSHIVNSNSFIDLDKVSSESIEGVHASLLNKTFVKATGWVSIEDYDRLMLISERFNDISTFINECGVSQTGNVDYIKLRKDLDRLKKEAKSKKDRNTSVKELARISKLESDLQELVFNISGNDKIPEYLVEGIQLFINTFLPKRINFRFSPYEIFPEFEILSNLKRENFVETDIENIIFSYGSRPNLKLTVFGILTSLPQKNQELFDPLEGIVEDSEDESVALETAFRGVFRAFENFEKFVRYSDYPRITINPLAVYKEIEL